MTNLTLGLALMSPLAWFLLFSYFTHIKYVVKNWQNFTAAGVFAFFILLALWGVYVLMGGV
jgi:hypothetical protein